MSSDASLYGIPKPKQKPKELSSSSSLAFTSTLTSLLKAPSTNTSAGRPRPSKRAKDDVFTSHNRNTKKRAAKDLSDDPDSARHVLGKQDIGSVDDATLHRSKRKLQAKAKLYKEMKRSDYAGPSNPDLVDFDRKWAERDGEDSSSLSSEDPDPHEEEVEYEDEFGRMRSGPRSEAERAKRRIENRALGQEELNRMSARPAAPGKLIYGDTVQTMAFNPDEERAGKMSELAAKRDRSATPPEMKHYEADKEFRIKGVGFYSFSKDEETRMQEMEQLERERVATERVRREREVKKQERKREVEERRRLLVEKRARKQADEFLERLDC